MRVTNSPAPVQYEQASTVAPAPPKPPPPPPPPPPAPESSFQSTTTPRPKVSLSGDTPPATSLHTEQLGDGQANCLEQATAMSEPGDTIVLCDDRTDASGHAIVLHPDGSVSDPNQPGIRYPDMGSWQASHPQYQEAGRVPSDELQNVLSLPPGPEREAEIERLGLQDVAGVAVADVDPSREELIQQLNAYGVTVTGVNGKEFSDAELDTLLTTVSTMAERLNAAADPPRPAGDTTLFRQLFGPLEFSRQTSAPSGYATNRGNIGQGVTQIVVGDQAFSAVNQEGGMPPRTGNNLTTQELLTHEIAHTLNLRQYANDPRHPDREFIANWYGRTQPDRAEGGAGMGFQAGQKVGQEYTGAEQVTDAIANWFLGSFTPGLEGRAARFQMNHLMGNLIKAADTATVRY